MKAKKIVITGGPGTGKTSIINELKKRGYPCIDEISRQITLEAREQGTEQLFLSDPLIFSEKLLEARISQYNQAETFKNFPIFLDRGIPDILAYMYYVDSEIPKHFLEACQNHPYDEVFVLAPWQEIFESDNERYENFDQAKEIHEHLLNTYSQYNYKLHDVPFNSVENRTQHLLNFLGI